MIGVPLLCSIATAPFPSVIDFALESITTSVPFLILVLAISQPAAVKVLLINEKFAPTKNVGVAEDLHRINLLVYLLQF